MDNEKGDTGSVDAKAQADNDGLRALLAKNNNDALTVAGELYAQTYHLREDRRALQAEVKTLKEQQAPEGSVVLTADQAKAWSEYQGLGKPGEVQQRLTDAKQAKKDAQVARIASSAGYSETVLKRLLGDAEITVEEKDGVQTYKVGTGSDAKTIQEMVEGDWQDFAPALNVNAKQAGKPVVGQDGSRKGSETDYVGQYLDRIQPPPKEA